MIAIDFFGIVFHSSVSSLTAATDVLKTQLLHDDAYFSGAERMLDKSVDTIQDMGCSDENAVFSGQEAALASR